LNAARGPPRDNILNMFLHLCGRPALTSREKSERAERDEGKKRKFLTQRLRA